MEAYFDNSATTIVTDSVKDIVVKTMTEDFGNPSAMHMVGVKAEKYIKEAQENIAKILKVDPKEIFFTSGGTESNNMAIIGTAMANKRKGNKIITTSVEHSSVLATMKYLEEQGFEVIYLPVDRYGVVQMEALEKEMTEDTILVSTMYVNNEVGTINNIKELAEICKSRDVKIHSDLTQALGKLRINVSDLGLDFASCSAHKIYGPKGIGAAFLKSDAYGIPPITALLHGGEQEYGLRAGTLAVHNIVGFGKAAEIALRDMDNTEKHIKRMDEYALRKLQEIEEVELCNPTEKRIPGIISILINKTNFHNERFIKKVSDQLAISSGSACSAGEPSYVIKAMGLEKKVTKVLRITINKHTSKEDIDQLVTIISNTI